ncbi:MAG: COQ9 family protein [Sphingomonadales bacterium]|nr:COQ9 family protein [Sphingomonadales bacterium]
MTADHASLDALRLALAPAVADAAVFDGWSEAALDAAAAEQGVDPALARFAFRGGAMVMIAAWITRIDADMALALPQDVLAKLPIRERIRRLVRFRLDALAGREEALRRAQAIMARPRNVAAALAHGWNSADRMWRLAGDTAADFNHYTKRTTLAGIYAATLAVFAGDSSEGKAETLAFLDRRIEGVMRFEKAKARLLRPHDEHFSMARFLGRLRYPAA